MAPSNSGSPRLPGSSSGTPGARDLSEEVMSAGSEAQDDHCVSCTGITMLTASMAAYKQKPMCIGFTRNHKTNPPKPFTVVDEILLAAELEHAEREKHEADGRKVGYMCIGTSYRTIGMEKAGMFPIGFGLSVTSTSFTEEEKLQREKESSWWPNTKTGPLSRATERPRGGATDADAPALASSRDTGAGSGKQQTAPTPPWGLFSPARTSGPPAEASAPPPKNTFFDSFLRNFTSQSPTDVSASEAAGSASNPSTSPHPASHTSSSTLAPPLKPTSSQGAEGPASPESHPPNEPAAADAQTKPRRPRLPDEFDSQDDREIVINSEYLNRKLEAVVNFWREAPRNYPEKYSRFTKKMFQQMTILPGKTLQFGTKMVRHWLPGNWRSEGE